jgi:hypothetical protein
MDWLSGKDENWKGIEGVGKGISTKWVAAFQPDLFLKES